MEDKSAFRGGEPLALKKSALADIQRRAALGGSERKPRPRAQGAVAIIPVHGPLTYYDSWFSTSMRRIGAAFDAAVADKHVSAIVLDVDSPGGTVAGTPELADKIFSASGRKPIIAIANHEAASAALWIGTAAENFVITPSGEAGSIGVWTMHVDQSGYLEKAGLDVSLVSAGKYKVEGNPFNALDEEARTEMQRSVDESYREFVGAVARHRGTSPRYVEERFGQGRMLSARKALAVGMVDGITTLESLISDIVEEGTARQFAYEDGIGKMLFEAWGGNRHVTPVVTSPVRKEDIAAQRKARADQPRTEATWRYRSEQQRLRDEDQAALARAMAEECP